MTIPTSNSFEHTPLLTNKMGEDTFDLEPTTGSLEDLKKPENEKTIETGYKPDQPPMEFTANQRCVNCCARMRSTVTIEPAVFIYFLGFSSLRFTIQQFVYTEYLKDWNSKYGTVADQFNFSLDSSCDNLNDAQEDSAQETTAKFLMIYDTLCLLPGVLFVLFAGGFSDRYGRKKALLSPVVGVTIRALICFLVGVTNLNVNFMYIGALIDGFSGGQCMFVATAYACVADVSGKEHRSLRFYIIQAVNGIGLVAGQLSIGYLIYYTGFVYPYLILFVIISLDIPIIIFYMHESVDKNNGAHSGENASSIKMKDQLSKILKMLISGPEYTGDIKKVHIVRMLIVIVLLMGISTEGLISSLTLYLLRSPRCFTSVELAYFLVVLMLCGGIASLGVVGFLNKIFSDYGILTIGMVSSLLGKVMLIIPFQNPLIGPYGCAIVSCFGSLPNSLVRSALSKLSRPDQQGAMSGCVTISQQLGVTLGGFFLSAIYSITVSVYAETIFTIAVGINTIAMILVITVLCLRRGVDNDQTSNDSVPDDMVPIDNSDTASISSMDPATFDTFEY